MLGFKQCHNKQTSGKGERKKRGSKSSDKSDKDDEFIPSSSKTPKSFIGTDNLDVETIEQIQD